jgi:hypothetical protein
MHTEPTLSTSDHNDHSLTLETHHSNVHFERAQALEKTIAKKVESVVKDAWTAVDKFLRNE